MTTDDRGITLGEAIGIQEIIFELKNGAIMDNLEFISSLINSLVWPSVTIITVFILKGTISEVMLGINKIKYNDFQMDFGKELAKIESTINQSEDYGKSDKKQLKNDKAEINNISNKNPEQQIKAVAEISPVAAVIMTWSLVENKIQSTILKLSISPDYPFYNSALKNVQLLKENNYIDKFTEQTLTQMRILRNKILHEDISNEPITYSEAIAYCKISMNIALILKTVKR